MLTKKVLNNVYCRSRPVPTAKVLELAGSGVATGGKRSNLPPPPPPQIGHPVRSMQIRGDFRIRKKMGVGLQDLLRRFTCTDATVDVLWSYYYEKRGSCESC